MPVCRPLALTAQDATTTLPATLSRPAAVRVVSSIRQIRYVVCRAVGFAHTTWLALRIDGLLAGLHDIQFLYGIVRDETVKTEARESRTEILAEANQLTDGTPHGRTRLHAMPRNYIGQDEIPGIRVASDDCVLIEDMERVVSGPGLDALAGSASGNAMGEEGPEALFKESVVDLRWPRRMNWRIEVCSASYLNTVATQICPTSGAVPHTRPLHLSEDSGRVKRVTAKAIPPLMARP